MSGIFLRSFFEYDSYTIIFIFFLGCVLLILQKFVSTSGSAFVVGLACIFLSLGAFRLHVADTHTSALSEYEGKTIELVGKIVREPEVRETTLHLYIKPLIDTAQNEQVLVSTDKYTSEQFHFSYGDVVITHGQIEKPEAFESEGGREFDYPGYLKTKHVSYLMRYADVSLEKKSDGGFLSNIYSGKEKFQTALEDVLPMPHAGLGEGILLGVKRALGKDLEQTFRETGIIHIVVLSGYNVMIVVEAMMFILAYFFLPRMRMILGLVAIALFVILVGPSATVVRASLMASLLLVARATGRTYAILRALMLAGVVMLLINPYLLVHDPGFQLSFVATLALILFAPHVEKKLLVVPETGGLRTILTATIATQIFVLPLLLYHTGILSFVSVLVNALVLPMVPVAMLLTFLTGAIGLLSIPLGTIVGFITYYSLGYIIFISEFFGSFAIAATTVTKFPFWIVIMTYGLYVCALVYLSKKAQEAKAPQIKETTENLSDWVIEEEKTGDELRSSPDSLPFR